MPEKKEKKWMDKTRHFLHLDKLPVMPRKIIVGMVGGIFLIAGVVMIVTPGPAFILIPLGLLLLASEFTWAEKGAEKLMVMISRARKKWREKRAAQ